MERRDFLRKTSLAAILAMSPFRLEASDFNILNEVSREELASLREVLEVDESEIQTDESTGAVHLNADRWPAIIYNFSLNPENIGINGELTSTGSAFVLNDQGFFLTVDHTYEEGKIMLVYDPMRGYALPARPLVHSTKDDIFLGKIDLPPQFSTPTTRISSSNEPLSGRVYFPSYTNRLRIKSTFADLIQNGNIRYDEDSQLSFSQTELLVRNGENGLGAKIEIGRVIDVTLGDGRKLCAEGQSAFIAGVIQGNSGSPVFDFRNNLTGILTARDEISVVRGDLPAGQKVKLGIYTGSGRIREMIESYIKACE